MEQQGVEGMEKRALRSDRQMRCSVLVMALGAGLLLMSHAVSMVFASLAYAQEARDASTGPAAPLNPNADLAMKITAPFTLAAVGDFRGGRPIALISEPRLQNLIKILRGADVSFANMEGAIFDGMGSRGLRKELVIADLKAFGFQMLGYGNNHTTQSGVDRMFSTMALLDEAGIVHAGSGKDLREARAPRFLYTPKGIVGLVAMMSVSDSAPRTRMARNSTASYSTDEVRGTPGVNGLHLTTYNVVTAGQLQALRNIRDSVYARRNEVPWPKSAPTNEPTDRLELFGTHYKVGPKPGDLSYTMDPNDLRENLRSIRNGKLNADFMIATVHCHQNSFEFQDYMFDNAVPDFLVDLAHQAIDNGADAFIVHGVHALRGVEIYKGKPIFYGLSTFWLEALGEHFAPMDFQDEVEAPQTNTKVLGQIKDFEALLATSRYEGGRLAEVRLYPVDLGQSRVRSDIRRTGIPMTPSPEMARRMIEKMQTMSKPFGTTISIEDNVGVIHVPPEAQQSRK